MIPQKRELQQFKWKKFIKVIDYDHVDGDKNYMLFYEYQENSQESNSIAISEFGVHGVGNDGQIIASTDGLGELTQSFGWDAYSPQDQKANNITRLVMYWLLR